MDNSFANYRPNTSDVTDNSYSSDVIDVSNDSSFMERNKRNTDSKKEMVIPDSDEDSDVTDMENSFLSLKMRKGGVKNRILSDTESEPEETAENGDDNMTMSAATRLSIFGVKPLGASSDDSDIIESDPEENERNSSPEPSLCDMAPNPHIGEHISPKKTVPSNLINDSNYDKSDTNSSSLYQEAQGDYNSLSDYKETSFVDLLNEPSSDNEIEIIPPKAKQIINLSSDDDIQEINENVPEIKNNSSQPLISKFVKDYTYPNSGVVYVKKQIKENEMNKLNSLRAELQKVNYLLESMNISTLPDKGVKLKRRAEELVKTIKSQAEKVSNMVVEPDVITKDHVKNDGFVSWEDIRTGSTAVKPTKFGTIAMNTHMTQRNMTLESLRSLYSSLDTRPNEDAQAEMPRGLKTELMPHQLHALAWLPWRETQKPRGGILADDMGLGKTLTMISLVLHAKENNKENCDDDEDDDENDQYNNQRKGKLVSGGTLVVCPASLLRQWYGEIGSHCKKNYLKAHIHHGMKREVSAVKLARNDVVITTYNLVQRDLEKCGTLMRIRWERVILDEAHTVRNHKSQTACAVFRLSAGARWCLTGTPVHNKDLDLFALLKFLRCSPFDDIMVWKKWIDNKSTGGQERLSMIMKSLLLRRTKQQLQEQKTLECLPQKSMYQIQVELSKEEMNVYQKVLVFSKTLFAQFLHQRAEKNSGLIGFAQKTYEPNKEYDLMHRKMVAMHGAKQIKSHEILVLLLRLRQICCHAGLIHAMLDDEQYEGNPLDQSDTTCNPDMDMLKQLASMDIEAEESNLPENDQESTGTTVTVAMSKVLRASNPVFNLERKSAKIQATLKCLQENVFIHKNDKAVVVSQWTSMLDIVERNLKKMGVVCATLSGKVPVTARHEIVKKFNDPSSKIQVLLLSLCAGGVGLNLIGGNHLLLLDLHWNPQLEAQAQDRIYRVGQSKPVHIYKFMCIATVEQSIKMIQDKKLELANSVLTGAKMTHSSKLSIDDLKLMFNMT